MQSRPITHEEPQSKQWKYTWSAIVSNNEDTQGVPLSVTLMQIPLQYQDTKSRNEATQREYNYIYINGHYKKYTCTNGVPQSRMKTKDAENTMICLNH